MLSAYVYVSMHLECKIRYLYITLVNQLRKQIVVRLNNTLNHIYIRSGVETLAMEFEFAVKTKAFFAKSFYFCFEPNKGLVSNQHFLLSFSGTIKIYYTLLSRIFCKGS